MILKRSFKFLSGSPVQLPDTFFPAAYFDCHGFYLYMIRNFTGLVDPSESGSNSSLIIIDTSGVRDVLQYSTVEDPGDIYVRCWIQNADTTGIPWVVTRKMQKDGDEPGALEGPVVYKILAGKFKEANNVKLDTAFYSFEGL